MAGYNMIELSHYIVEYAKNYKHNIIITGNSIKVVIGFGDNHLDELIALRDRFEDLKVRHVEMKYNGSTLLIFGTFIDHNALGIRITFNHQDSRRFLDFIIEKISSPPKVIK